MKFWAACAGTLFDWPRKLVPYYRNPSLGCYTRSELMIDSGVGNPGTVEAIIAAQLKHSPEVGVSPDIIGEPDLTVARTREWIAEVKNKIPKMSRLISLQGSPDQMKAQIGEFWSDASAIGVGGLLLLNTEQRDAVMRSVVPEIHAAGRKCHVFGIGSNRRDMLVMRELGVDSFDTSTVVQYAKAGCVFDSQLRRRYVGGPKNEEHKRALLRINCAMIQFVAESGFEPMQEEILQEWYSEIDHA